MTEPTLVHIVDDVPELEGLERLPMVLVLDGFLDAGNAAARAAQHLVDLADTRVVATFDVDQLHDYRARRPPMSFVRDHYASYDPPRLVVRLCHDTGGTPYLLLHGPEPDIRWEAFCRGVRTVVERFGVHRVVSLGSVPMAVPHTRPIAITQHANDPDLLTGESRWRGELRIPSSAQAVLEVRLGEWGHDAMGFVAHIPHYLAQLDYPAASISLLEHVERAAWLTVDLSGLRAEAEDREAEVSPLPLRQRGRRRGGGRPGAAVRHLRAGRGQRSGAARDRPAAPDRRRDRRPGRAVPRRASTGPTPTPTTTEGLRCPHPPRSSSSCSRWRTSTATCSAASSPTPACSGSSAARSPRRR